ncbi:putative epoxide hydrolase [Xylariaceae sp. AK1471]|nr:putative epoxide hydrolase [Xylariaceae sp. AK1471]
MATMASSNTIITEHDVVYAAGEKKIHYCAAGPNGPLIFFIHGWVGTGITWKAQIEVFAALGFRVVAPDMPGYGKSTARRVVDDYCQEAIVEGMMALLRAQNRSTAIWVGHDWGAGVTSSVATQHPEVVKALINLCVPFRTIELGWQGLLPLIDRALYPEAEYEFGQWDYMKNYEENFEQSISWFDSDIAGFCKLVMQRPHEIPISRVATMFATIRKTGGWLGGIPKPPPVEATGPPMLQPDVFDSFVDDMKQTGFWPASAYYLHHKRNAAYNGKMPGKLTQPVLFIHAMWDMVCETKTSRFAEPMRKSCSNLTEVTIESGHCPQYEKPAEVNAAICRFIIDELPSEWPGFWDRGYTKRKAAQ